MPKLACPATWVRHAGDIGDTLMIEVSDALGVTLDDVDSVIGLLEDANGTLPDVELDAAVSDSDDRIVTVQLGTWLETEAEAGQTWWVSLQITVGSATITFPEKPSKRLGIQIV